MSDQTKPRLLLTAALAALAVPIGGALAALPGHAADTSTDMSTDTAVGRVMAPTDAAPVRVADNDDDDDDHGWRRAGGRHDRKAMRRGGDDDDHDDDDDDDARWAAVLRPRVARVPRPRRTR